MPLQAPAASAIPVGPLTASLLWSMRHPHYSNDKKIAIVHNGIIENYLEIKERLTNKGFTSCLPDGHRGAGPPASDILLHGRFRRPTALDAIARTMLHVRGSYALGVLCADASGRRSYAARKRQPADCRACREEGNFIASDIPAAAGAHPHGLLHRQPGGSARLTPDTGRGVRVLDRGRPSGGEEGDASSTGTLTSCGKGRATPIS